MTEGATHRLVQHAGHLVCSWCRRMRSGASAMEAYRDRHAGQRCIIMGNGPSLNRTDLSLLNGEICFGANKIYLLFKRTNFRPTYIVSIVPDVIRQSRSVYEELPIPLFLHAEGRAILKHRRFETVFFGRQRPLMFSLDPGQEIAVGHTVTYVTLQLAYFMGFTTVILVGVDHDFGDSGPADRWQVIAPGDEQSRQRHFDPDYFAVGQTWQSPNLEMAEAYYAFAHAAYRRARRRIIDSTVDGRLRVFPRASLAEALRMPVGT